MPYRKTTFTNGCFYHLYNKCNFDFFNYNLHRDFKHIINLVKYYQYESNQRFSHFIRLNSDLKALILKNRTIKYIDLIAFSIMPNHYHFLVRQKTDNGVREFITSFQLSLSKFLELKYKRHGRLFLRRFGSALIDSDELILHISRYIHLNPVTAYLININQLSDYPYTSFTNYCHNNQDDMLSMKYIISKDFNIDSYKKFVFDNVDYQRKLSLIKKQSFDHIPG